MRKLISLLLAMLLLTVGAYAEDSFTIAGYDHVDTKHVWTENLFFQRMEAVTGVHLETVQYDTKEAWDTAKAAMLAGTQELPDALFKANLTTRETAEWYAAGKLIDLKPYLAEHAPNLWALLESHPEWMEAVTLPTGEIVALPAMDEAQFTNAMWINSVWLQMIGKPAPTTAEELTEVLRAFRDRDMNGNGKRDDETPLTFSSMWDLRFLGHAFGINANDYYVTMDEAGKVSEVLTTEANRAFLTWLHQLWEENLLDKMGFTGVRDMSLSMSDEKEVVYGVALSSSPVQLVEVEAMKQYTLLEPLTYEGKQVYRDLTGDVIRGTFAITSACDDPAALLRWVDYLYTEEGFILSEAGLEGEEFTINEDGSWLWETSNQESLDAILADTTLRSGTSMPGYTSVEFQKKIDDVNTQHVLNCILRLREIDSLPYPFVYLTQEQQNRVDELILRIGQYAERQMVWFVVGDVELNDETWAEFCAQIKALGMDEMVNIWQTAADNQR